MRFGVICTTRGNKERQLLELVKSIPEDQPFSLCWQSSKPIWGQLEHALLRRGALVSKSAAGASLGRNTAAFGLLAQCSVDYLLFPNDDCLFPIGFFNELEDCIEDRGYPGLLTIPVLHQGADGRFVARRGLEATAVTSGDRQTVREIVRASHEPGLVVSTDAFRAVGGFDVGIGVGSSDTWQSGEGPDLAFRILTAGRRMRCSAVPVVHEQRRSATQPSTEKALAYLPGVVYVSVRNRGLIQSLPLIIRSWVGSTLRARSLAPSRLIIASMRGGRLAQDLYRSELR